ncbi:hypothetical protein HHK36_009626 [Tetracentron sinense]|uniref:Dof zinc finger protein n=1 Tax=Tetracentron sinense TaxID=13715 RepID=A0A834ZLN7_TETSI|nr:hypothetical protein HHK36_009626 [Tetracentron sinense]
MLRELVGAGEERDMYHHASEMKQRYPLKQSIIVRTDKMSTAKPVTNTGNQSSEGRKTAPSRPPEQALKCPRCDSPNTKFCYYNNYSLTQPRHFCKTCRRYWTNGGALRNVPIGGGCRKSKKIKSASRLSGDSSSNSGGLNFLHGLTPAMDFQLGGHHFSRLHSSTTGGFNQFVSFGGLSRTTTVATNPSCFNDGTGSLMGFNYPISSVLRQGESGVFNGGIQEMGSMNVHSSLASSIESLSSINQDLHRKLQQQRLALLFGGENQKENSTSVSSLHATLLENQIQKPQPNFFQNLEISKPEVCAISNPTKSGVTGNTATDQWFFENTYTPTTANNSSTSHGNDNTGNWNGIQTWSDIHDQYSSLP